MATLAGTNPTLIDWTKQLEPDGGITSQIVEMLAQTNEMLLDMTFVEANNITSHRTTIRTGLPSATWRQFYQGVAPSKSTVAQVDETIGMLEARSVVDKDLAELNGDVNQFRMNEASAFLEAMNQEMQQTVLYGNVGTDPTEFNGLTPRLNTLSSAASSENVINAEGSDTDNTSIWLIGWGENTVHGLFPKGSSAGLKHEDLGIDHNTPDGQTPTRYFSAYHDKFEWKAGLCVKDWRYTVRICNIDKSNLVAESSAADILKLMTMAVHKIPALGVVRPAFYVNRTVMTMLDIQAQSKSNVYLNVGEEEGRKKVSFRGIPIRMCDQITNAETLVA
jgi:hypothetical protein